MKRVVLASGNPGKISEIGALLAPLAIEVVPQSKLGISEADEPHQTFLENALAKARHASRAAGLPALADDSGLCVDALGGAPGVHSAYYAGREGNREQRDARNNRKLLENLKNDRWAHYVCVMTLVKRPQDDKPLLAEGRWHGEIAARRVAPTDSATTPFFLSNNWEKLLRSSTRISKTGSATGGLLSRSS